MLLVLPVKLVASALESVLTQVPVPLLATPTLTVNRSGWADPA